MAFWVMIYHIKDAIDIPVLSTIINKGYLGVDVFFVLSGYILTHVYFDLLNRKISLEEYLNFIQKRVARIYPLHLVTLIGAFLFSIVQNQFIQESQLYIDHIPYQLLMIHSWGFLDNARLNYPSWSISAEWFAYLIIFPFASVLFAKSINIRTLVILILLLVLMSLTYHCFNNDFGNELGFGIIRIIPEFLMGCSIYDLSVKSKKKSLFASILIYILVGFLGWSLFHNVDFFLICTFPVLILVLHKLQLRIFTVFFETKIPIFLGEISYSLYMTHFFAWKINGIIHRNFFGEEFNSPIYVINYILLTLIISIIAYYLIEIPARRYINNIRLSKN